MGVIYKLKPEIKNWILEQKRTHPVISCRGLISLIEDEFKIKVSKSSINSLFKEAGLSMPIGRRQKKKSLHPPSFAPAPSTENKAELPLALPGPQSAGLTPRLLLGPEAPKEPLLSPVLPEAAEPPLEQIPDETSEKILSSGTILLKAVDCLTAGSYSMSETIKQRLGLKDEHLLSKIENLIYAPLLNSTPEALNLCLQGLKAAEPLIPEITRNLSRLFTVVRCIKILLSNAQTLYLDGLWHTVWSVPHIPYEFGNSICDIKSYIKKIFSEEDPLILQMAPGYDRPTGEFFNFILSLEHMACGIAGLSLYDSKLREIEFINWRQDKKRFLIFGLWPWQFTECRRVKKIGDFRPFYFQAQRKNLYLADVTVELEGPDKKSIINFFGCALKNNPSEKTRLMIIGNFPEGSVQAEYLANLYLGRWPNIEEGFQDFSRKVELFTYTADSRNLLELESIAFEREVLEVEQLFSYYLKALDLYFRQFFLPCGYEDADCLKGLYRLKADLQTHGDYRSLTFQPPADPACLKALEYACRRLNERQITLIDHQRLWFNLP